MGLIATVALTPDASAAPGVYVTNNSSGDISAFTMGTDGGLTRVLGSPFGTDFQPSGVAATPNGANLYVANLNPGEVTAYAIGANKVLTPAGAWIYPTGGLGPVRLAVTPDGAHLYVTNEVGGSLSAFTIRAGGTLTPVPGSPFLTGNVAPQGVAVTPDGAHLYVADANGPDTGDLSGYNIAKNGAPSPMADSPFPAGSGPLEIAVTPDGAHMYVADVTSNAVTALAIGKDGTPTTVGTFPVGTFPVAVAVSPDGAHLYVSNAGSPPSAGSISAFTIGSGGSLTAVTGSPFPFSGPGGLAVSPDSAHLYVTTRGSLTVSAFTIGADGGLTAVAGSPFVTRSAPSEVVVTPDQGPVARFSAVAAPAGSASTFDGSASSDSDGKVVGYSWRFGDGSTATKGGPKPSHTYATAGTYKVMLTVTDNDGCSTRQVFTGQTMSCNGSAVARVTQTINVPGKQLCAGRAATIAGSAGADRLAGTPKANVIAGGSGNDRISAGGGNDLVCAGAGNDRVLGGPGNDTLFGGAGNDILSGGRGNDHIFGGPGNDRINPGPGRDHVDAGPGNDRIFSVDGQRDVIDCGPGHDVAIVDKMDVVRHCEVVIRMQAPKRP